MPRSSWQSLLMRWCTVSYEDWEISWKANENLLPLNTNQVYSFLKRGFSWFSSLASKSVRGWSRDESTTAIPMKTRDCWLLLLRRFVSFFPRHWIHGQWNSMFEELEREEKETGSQYNQSQSRDLFPKLFSFTTKEEDDDGETCPTLDYVRSPVPLLTYIPS